ncbi:TOG domain-containing protein [Mycena indigotica]|uniref:TOG domain-containing protein n=1 Tax=Mycena indigotica TaxID=2126181 RepID=A0A8H6T2C4_9AGAR|nr:TOG domain-containing protein [Mycena indigotica]KAF7309756.1 TOG domain-containing protein [Mycena indigotica]
MSNEEIGSKPSWPSSNEVFEQWDLAMRVAHDTLLNGRVTERTQFIHDHILPLCDQELGSRQTMDIFALLTSTYPRYTDSESRAAVEQVGAALIRQDTTLAEPVVIWLNSQSTHANAPTDIFALLSWACALLPLVVDTPQKNELLRVLADLRNYPRSEGIPRRKLPTFIQFLLIVLEISKQLPDIISTLLGLRAIPLLGTTIDVVIHLKHTPEPVEARLSAETKAAVLDLYCKDVIECRTPVPRHILSSLELFIATYVESSNFDLVVLPSLEKALSRSSISGACAFLTTYKNPIPVSAYHRLFGHILPLARNPSSVSEVVQLFKSAIAHLRANEDQSQEVNTALQKSHDDIISLPRSRKTASGTHRATLYGMLAGLGTPADSSLDEDVSSLLTLLGGESAPDAAVSLGDLLTTWIGILLATKPSAQRVQEIGASVAKGMATKSNATLRATWWSIGATLLWNDHLPNTGFTRPLLPVFDTALTAVGTGLTAKEDVLQEAVVAAACLLRLADISTELAKEIAGLATVRALSTTTTGDKATWLFNERVYSRIGVPREGIDPDVVAQDAIWCVRALAGAWKISPTTPTAQSRLGSSLLHFALRPHPRVRKVVIDTISAHPGAGATVIAGIAAYVSKNAASNGKVAHCAAFLATGIDHSEQAVAEVLIFAHHHLINAPGRQTWIDICQRAGIDPRDVVVRQGERIVDLILAGAAEDPKTGLPAASYAALTTIVFVAPDLILPRIVQQLQADIDCNTLNSLTEEELGMWRMPEGTAFIDVLASAKNETKAPQKGKDFEIARWEAEVRKTLDSKKASGTALTKQQQAQLQAQLARESVVRQRVNTLKTNLIRGLAFIRSIVAASTPDLRVYVPTIAQLLLDGALRQGSLLVGEVALETYLELAKCCSDRLDTFRLWLAIATLRSLNIDSVPEDMRAEPLNNLVIRVLLRFRSLSEQVAFDSATFSYAFPLLATILKQGGIQYEDEDESLEQLALTIEIVKFHCGEFTDAAFPRKQTIEALLAALRQQLKLAKEASSALVELGEAAHANASRDEIQILLQGTLAQEAHVRTACLQTLQPFDLTDLDWSPELWAACHDEDEQNTRLARHIWDDNGLDIPESFLPELLAMLGHDNVYVRRAAAPSIAEAVQQWPQILHTTLIILEDYYRSKAKILAPEFDEFGMVIAATLDRSDPWQARAASSAVFELLAPLLSEEEVEPFFVFLVQDEALGDRAAEVRQGMLSAGTVIIDLHGASCLSVLISMFEAHLAQPSPATETGDQIKEAVVILFGRLARHLDATDLRVPSIVDRLIEALETPSEQVQIAVSDCLSPLVKLMGDKLAPLVDKLMTELFDAPKYAARRGAAYGLAGVLKGTGIAGMKQFDIIRRLRLASEDKKRYESRQGTMFAFETLSTTLGRPFEPYITYVLPLLLASFGDSTNDVREATQDAARIIMANMSGYGVKLILPSLLSGLDEKQWRSKKGSIELLGMMAYCSPRQLSLSLPIVIPRLTGVLTDSHAQVRAAANKSLKQFGEVITNPEIQSLVPILLKALVDPGKTPNALSSLLKTSFMHYIDHSSLALVVPIIERGLRERGADTKKKAAQIVGNLASLTDPKDFVPYLSKLLPMVHQVLVDPVPEARATAAKALGTLVERLGEIHFPDLVPGLLRTLKTDTSGVDRQGAAQGLSEVLSGLGMERLEGLLPDILANAQSPRPTVREGFMSLLVFLPATFGSRFQPHLPKIITPILSGLADVEEYVREAAMRAGRMVVTNYSSKAIDLLLPELEHGMFDSSWRIRQSSITLVGELLFKVSGISGKTSDLDEDETAEVVVSESSKRALVEVLGTERRDRILASLYLVRQDGVGVVRTTSIQIWKALVNNTPRTVREILPELVRQILFLISSNEFEQQETTGRTIGELCRKFGDRVLSEMVAILRTNSTSQDSRTREGVCLMLSEIMENSTESQREGHDDDIIAIVRGALVDDESNVRTAAARAFDILQEHIGPKAIDQTIPTLLDALRQPGKSSGTALKALREVMSVRASTVFPVLIPTLTATPMTAFNARALATLVTVAGTALSRRLTTIMTALVRVLEDTQDEELQGAVDEAVRALLASVSDAEGLNTLMLLLLGWAKHDSPRRRVSACDLFAIFCEESTEDSSLYRVDWIRQLVSLLEDQQVPVHTAAWTALDVFVKSLPKDELEPLVVPLRRSIESTGGPGHHVPGFGLPKGIAPTVPIIIAGLTTGSNEQREQAAYAIGDLVERTEENAIKAYVVPFTGPLIRVATQAATYPPPVKTAILVALTTMLERIPVFVKPFFPQLQRTFVKSASDPASVVVRTKAAQALGALMRNQPRVDPVVTELITGIGSNDDTLGSSLILALSHVVRNASQHIGEKARDSCVELANEAFRETHDETYTRAIGDLIKSLSVFPNLLRPLVEAHLVGGTPPSIIASQTILAVVTPDQDAETPELNLFQKLSLMPAVMQKIKESLGSDKPFITRPAREARDVLRTLEEQGVL